MLHHRRPILATFLLLDSLAIFILWPLILESGAFPHGLMVYHPVEIIPMLHLLAELLMAGISLAAAVGLWIGAAWGEKAALFGLGMFSYAAINSLGWALHHDFPMAVTMAGTLLLAALAVPSLLFGHPSPTGDEAAEPN